MSFFSDLFTGNFSNLPTDIEHAPSSLASHPDELAETLGGVAAVASGGLLLGELAPLGAAAGAGELGAAAGGEGILTGGSAIGLGAGDFSAASAAGEAALGAGDAALPATSTAVSGALGDVGLGSDALAAGGGDVLATPSGTALGFGGDILSTPTANSVVGGDFSALAGGIDPSAAAGNPIVGDVLGGGTDALAAAPDAGFSASLPSTDLGLSGGATFPEATDVATSTIPGSPDPLAAGGGTGSSALTPAGGSSLDATALNAPASTAPSAGVGTPTSLAAPAPAGAAPAAGGATPAAAGGGWMGTAANALKVAAPLASLGYLGYTLAKGPAPLPPQAGQLSSTDASLQSLANTDLAMVQNNQLTPAQAASIAQQQSQLTSQWKQVLMNQGVTNPEQDSRWPQIQALIDQQTTAATQSMIQTTLSTALGASGQASSNLIALANMQVQSNTNYTTAVGNAVKALGSTVAATSLVGAGATKLAA